MTLAISSFRRRISFGERVRKLDVSKLKLKAGSRECELGTYNSNIIGINKIYINTVNSTLMKAASWLAKREAASPQRCSSLTLTGSFPASLGAGVEHDGLRSFRFVEGGCRGKSFLDQRQFPLIERRRFQTTAGQLNRAVKKKLSPSRQKNGGSSNILPAGRCFYDPWSP